MVNTFATLKPFHLRALDPLDTLDPREIDPQFLRNLTVEHMYKILEAIVSYQPYSSAGYCIIHIDQIE